MTDYTRRGFLGLTAQGLAAFTTISISKSVIAQEEPQPLEEMYRNVYVAAEGYNTLDLLSNSQSDLRTADHTLILFSVDEEASGWECPPCHRMGQYFDWRARESEHRGVEPTQLRYVLAKINTNTFVEPDFLESVIDGWPRIVHLVNGRDSEVFEDRISGLDTRGLRLLVERIEGNYI